MKKFLRSVLSLVMAAVMLCSVLPICISADNPFEDVSSSDYFYDAVMWAYDEGITTGTTETKFAPASSCTRGQVVTFLWRAMGEIEPKTQDNPFSDVKLSDYYYKAVLWAVEEGITTGTSADRFSPDVTCTNAHILTFIWRAMGEPDRTGEGEWFTDAVNWAKNGGLLGGTYSGDFSPSDVCPRANVVTYLYRYLSSSVLTLYVSPSGSDVFADGSAVNPFRTVEAARNAIRKLDKSKYTSIRVKISAGEYDITKSVSFTKEDSGTPSCRISYIGEEGTVFCGGVAFDSSSFVKADGDTMQYFPEEVRDRLVMIDLKQFGFKPEDVSSMVEITRAGGLAPLAMNGNNLTPARYPNDEFALVREGSCVNCEGGAANAVDYVTTTTIFFDEGHMEHVRTWHDLKNTFIQARYAYLWVPDNTNILSIDEKNSSMTVLFAGGYDPREGMFFYWYNVPEELDLPGEYYTDENCILYLYPTEDFEGAHFTMPLLNESIIRFDGAEYITLSDLVIEATRQNGISGNGNHITVDGCTVRSCSGSGISLNGDGIMISDNEIYSVGNDGINLTGGDPETLRRSDDYIYNNYIHEWSTGIGLMCYAISVKGCGVTVSHNECIHSVDMGIAYDGPYHLIEYNLCEDTCNFFGDGGVIGSGALWVYGTVVRYNYIKDGGFTRDTDIDIVGVQGITVDCGESGLTAYGNVIENVTGSGFGICGGRDNYIYGNLMMQCRYGIFYDSRYYAQIVRDGHGNRFSYPGYTNNKYWTGSFPILAKLTFEDGTNFDTVIRDKNFNAATVATVKDNVYYMDKAVADRNKLEAYSIENYVFDFAEIEIPSEENGKLYMYSSKRTTYDIEECIRNNESVLAITPEQFRQIGNID